MTAWDWHYRIFFDDKIRKNISDYSKNVNDDEMKIVKLTEAFYCSFFSFGILFDLLVENPQNADFLINMAEKNICKIIYTPELLRGYFEEETINLPISNISKDRMLKILKESYDKPPNLEFYWDYLKAIFGDSYDDIISEFDNDKYGQFLDSVIQEDLTCEFEEFFNDLYLSLSSDIALNLKFGNNAIKDFSVTIKDGAIYGEWWDKELLHSDRDKLILYKNNNQIKKDDFIYTIIHETYPGHGHFYNFVKNDINTFDQGAMLLIEGWATYCEWNSFPSEYCEYSKHNARAMLYYSNSREASLDEFAQMLWDKKIKETSDPSSAIQVIKYATQYVGFFESYYMGALWLEYVIDRKGKYSPVSFLKLLKKNNKGDFFSLWQ